VKQQLVLSLFPGIGLLDRAFEEAGFCVVRGPDVLWGGDVRLFHPPAGRFDGVIGGPPCQAFSPLAAMVRHNGHEPKFGNLIPEFERVINEATPQWFLMENVKQAPRPDVSGYSVHSFCLNNRQFGEKQNRTRRISFGHAGIYKPLLFDVVVFENPEFEYAACGGTHGIGGIGREEMEKAARRKGTLNKCVGNKVKSDASFSRLCELQGLPGDFLADSPFTVQGKCKAVGNGVPLAMGRALAKAVLEATREERA